MSKDGWQQFLAADLDDWAVLHGGATAVFRAASMADAAALAAAIARDIGADASGLVLTVSRDALSVRLTRDVWQLEPVHVERARAVSRIAADAGAVADRSAVQEVQFAIAARPDEIDLGFWQAVLGYRQSADDAAVDPLGHGSTVWMQELSADKSLRHAMHVDVSLPREEAERRLAAALAAGGRIVVDEDAPEYWILADRAGNKVCICPWPDGATST